MRWTDTHGVVTERMSTDQLAEGDVLMHHGMLLRLENRTTYPPQRLERGYVYCFHGVILNFDEIDDSFIRACATDGRPGTSDKPVWTVQGNELAVWTRLNLA